MMMRRNTFLSHLEESNCVTSTDIGSGFEAMTSLMIQEMSFTVVGN